MTKRWTLLAAGALLAGSTATAAALHGSPAAAMIAADNSTATITATTGTNATAGIAAPSQTPGFGDTPSPGANPSATPTGNAPHPTSTLEPARPPAHQPTPIPGAHKHYDLKKPIVVEVGTKIEGTGLTQKAALLLANTYFSQFLIVAPSYVPKGFLLQWIHVDPPQDQQTPPATWLQYIRTGLHVSNGAYPSFQVAKHEGTTTFVNPGGKVQQVAISSGPKGVGVVKGLLIDLKPKTGDELINISWRRLTIGYEVSSDVTRSRLSIKELLAVAAGVQ